MMKRLIRVDVMEADGANVRIIIDPCKEQPTDYLRFAAVAGVADALHAIIKDVTGSDEEFEYMAEYMTKIVKVGAAEMERRLTEREIYDENDGED